MTMPSIINIKGTYTYIFIGGQAYVFLNYYAPDNFSAASYTTIPMLIGVSQDLTTSPATFTDGPSALNYYASTYATMIMNAVNTMNGNANFTSYNFAIIDEVAESNLLAAINSSYISNTALSAMLSNYVTSTALSSALSGYVTNSALSAVAASIPAAQVNSDWNAASGAAQILNKPSIPSTTRTTSAITPSLVGVGATGTQISATKDSTVRATVSTSSTATIGGASTSVVALKICSTNNATEANWITVATLENDQTITLAVALQSIQVTKGQLCADVPAGWYYKLVNSGTGTHTEAVISGQQTIYG